MPTCMHLYIFAYCVTCTLHPLTHNAHFSPPPPPSTHTHTHTTSPSVCVSISEEGGHPDGSPLLRFSEKQTHGHGGKKALVSLYAEGSGHDEEYSGGQQRTVMIIRAPSGFADHVSFTEKKRGKSRGGASSGATPSSAGPGMYQDLNESYAFSFCDDDDDHYTSVS